jgi:hypothetical protein
VHEPPSAPDHPALQVQLLTAVLCAGELEFAGQLMQSSAPAELLYCPAPHAVHAPPFAPDQPALQVQLLKAVLSAGEVEFAGQLLQSASPAALYLPATHAVQVPPDERRASASIFQPALHVQLVKAVLCAGERELAGQLLQFASPAEPLYLPATHAVHVLPSAPDQPALQVQSVILLLATGELEFVGHASQLLAPAALFHFPAPHAVHAPPSSPE